MVKVCCNRMGINLKISFLLQTHIIFFSLARSDKTQEPLVLVFLKNFHQFPSKCLICNYSRFTEYNKYAIKIK